MKAKVKTLFDMMNDDSVLKELVEKQVMEAYISGMEKGKKDAQKELDELKEEIAYLDKNQIKFSSILNKIKKICNDG